MIGATYNECNLSWESQVSPYAEFCYTECRYTKCHYAECRGAKIEAFHIVQLTRGLYYKTIMIVTLTIISDATIWSVTYDHN